MNIVAVGWREFLTSEPVRKLGATPIGCQGNFWRDADKIKTADLLIVWNARHYAGQHAVEIAKRKGIPFVVVENGLIDQASTLFWDRGGLCGDSELNGTLDWVTDYHFDCLYEKRAELQEEYPLEPSGDVVVPLQIHNDTQVLYHTPYRTMDEFMADLAVMYPMQNVVIRPHPKSSAKRKPAGRRQRIEEGGEWLEAARRASVVVGLTSTCLYDAAILGVPVVALGDHPLRTHRRDMHDKVCAAALAHTTPRDLDIKAWLEEMGFNMESF